MMSKILLAVPTFETICTETYKSLWDMDKGGNEVVLECVSGYDCATARNQIAKLAVDRGADYTFMVDSDVVVPRDALIHLLDGEYDVALGYCCQRNNYAGRTTIYRLRRDDGTDYYDYEPDSAYTTSELHSMAANGINKVRIHGGGMACALIKTDVFRTLDYPWFYFVNYSNSSVLSEDLYFCELCKSKDIAISVDTRVGCGHRFTHIQWP